MQTDTKYRLERYRHSREIVAQQSKSYLEELPRTDNAHRARLSKQEEALREAVLSCAQAWNDIHKPLSEIERKFAEAYGKR